jgi:hypothetical protein
MKRRNQRRASLRSARALLLRLALEKRARRQQRFLEARELLLSADRPIELVVNESYGDFCARRAQWEREGDRQRWRAEDILRCLGLLALNEHAYPIGRKGIAVPLAVYEVAPSGEITVESEVVS